MVGPIAIAIVGDNSKLRRSVDDTNKRLGGMGGAVAKAGKIAALGLAGAGAGVVAWGVESVKSLARIERINARTANVIRSTGGAAGVSAKHVENLAGKLENLTATEAETTQEGANLLLTFTNVKNGVGKGNQIFDQATRTMVDMSRALGTDAKGSALQLGKALNDPIKGVGALSRVGVSFTEQQKAQIKGNVEAGKTMAAQKIILKELNKEFGGAGKAFAQTTEGKIELAKHAFGTLGETIFAKVLPPVASIAGALATFLNNLASGSGRAGSVVAKIGGYVGPFVDQLAGIGRRVLPSLQQLGSFLIANVLPVLRDVGQIVLTQVVPAVQTFAGFIVGSVVPAVVKIATQVGGSLAPIVRQLAATFRTSVLPSIVKLVAAFRRWQPTIQRVQLVVLKVTGVVLRLAAAILGRVLPIVIRLAGFLIRNVVRAFVFVGNIIIGTIRIVGRIAGALGSAGRGFADFAGKVRNKIGDAIRVITGIPGKVRNAVAGAASWLVNTGKNVIGGFISGLRSMAGNIISAIRETITDKLPGFVKKALGIASPSKLFRFFGRMLPAGLVEGLRQGGPALSKGMQQLQQRLQLSNQLTLPARVLLDPTSTSTTAQLRSAGAGRLYNGPLVQLVVEVAPTADRVAIGREIQQALDAWLAVGGRQAVLAGAARA